MARNIFKEMLEALGYRVVTPADVRVATERQRIPVKCVWLDEAPVSRENDRKAPQIDQDKQGIAD